MTKKNTLHLFIISIITSFVISNTFSQNNSDTIYFNSGSYTVSEQGKRLIKKIPLGKITIEGYTDHKGSISYNLQLSEKRVKSVVNLLTQNNHLEHNISKVHKGEKEIIDSTNLWKNRCVIIYYYEKEKNTKQDDLKRPIKQHFTFQNDKGLEFTFDNGIKIKILPNSFQTKTNDSIDFYITSYLTKADFILADLQSLSGTKLLESAGMFKLEAYQKSNTLNLKPEKSISIQIPNNERKKGFKLFSGKKNPHSTGSQGIDWIPKNTNKTDFLDDGFFTLAGIEQRFNINKNNSRFTSIGLIERKKYHKSKFFKIKKGTINYAFKDQKSPVTFFLTLQIEDKKIKKHTLKTESGELVKRCKKRLIKALNQSLWKQKNTTISLYFDYGEYSPRFNTLSREVDLENTDSTSLDFIVMNVTRIGWINCDRFYNTPGRKKAITIKADPKASVKIIFSDFTGLINGQYLNNQGFFFGKIPIDEPFDVLAYKIDTDGVLVAQLNNTNYKDKLTYKKITKKEFSKLLEQY